MKTSKQRVIYDTDYYEMYANESARREYCECNGIESVSDDDWAECCADDNRDWYDAERLNLKRELPGCIIAIARLQFWDGEREGARVVGSNLADILSDSAYDGARWYADAYNIRAELTHHDGTHRVLYRVANSEEAARGLAEKYINGEYTAEDVKRRTQSLRPYIAAVYGWSASRCRRKVNAVVDYNLRFDADGTAYRQRVTIALTQRQAAALNRKIKIARIADGWGVNLKPVGYGENYTTATAARLLAQYFGLNKNSRYKKDRNTVYNFQIVNK